MMLFDIVLSAFIESFTHIILLSLLFLKRLLSAIIIFEPFESASSTKSFPSKFSPFIAINNEFFFNDLVSVEIDFINALNFIFLLRNFAKSEVLVINFINYLMVTKMINFSINFLSLFMSFTKN